MKRHKFPIFVLLLSSALLLAGCNGNKNMAEKASGDMEGYANGNVNAIEQARPTIMVLPSDRTLKQFGCLKRQEIDGVNHVVRDFQSYLLKDGDARRLTAFIQDKFIRESYPLDDFEQTLKSLDTHHATDIADNLKQDAKTLLLLTAQPDIILEIDYKKTGGGLANQNANVKKTDYTLSALDAYTSKTIATVSGSNLQGPSTMDAIQNDLSEKLPKFMGDIQRYFSDILTRGRDVSVRINMASGCNVKLTDESIEGDTYSDWIVDYMKSHTVKGAYKMTRNTSNELAFQNCRIKLLNDDGTQYGVYDFTRDLQQNLKKNLGLRSKNTSQGLGQVELTIEGM